MLIYWFLAVICLSALRIGLATLYVHDNQCTQLRFYFFVLMTAFSAGLWGISGSLLMPPQHPVEQMIIIVVMAGIASGGIQSLQSSLISSLIYINFIILPLILWVFLQHETPYSILGLAVILYLLFNIALSIRSYKFLEQHFN
jgi:hypothetical protein